MKTLLTVPDADSAHALTLGAIFDASTRTFYAPAGTDLSLLGRWLPAGTSTELVAAARGMSFSQLLARITAAISYAFAAPEWVRVEISSLTKRNEHVYLDVVERDAGGTEVAKTRAVIWKGRANKIGEKFFKATEVHLSDGMKVLVAVEPHLGDAVDHQHRIAVRDQLQDALDVGHGRRRGRRHAGLVGLHVHLAAVPIPIRSACRS